MTDFWTSTRGPAGYGLFQRSLEWIIENEIEVSEIKMLDIGSSDGEGLEELTQNLQESTGKSLDTYALEPQSVVYDDRAAERSDNCIRGMVGHSCHSMPFSEDTFDIVISNHLLPFLDQDEQALALQDIHEVTHPHGYVALQIQPDENNASERLVMRYEDFDTLYNQTEAFTETPLQPERSQNLYHSDSRGLLPEGFYDEFYGSRR